MRRVTQIVHGNVSVVAGGTIIVNGTVINDCGDDVVVGNGQVETEVRPVSEIHRIVMDGPIELLFRPSKQPRMTVTTDQNLLTMIRTEVRGEALHVDCEGSFSTQHGIQVELQVPSMEDVEVTGSGTVTLEGLDQAGLSLSLHGSGDIIATGTVERLYVDLHGSGDVDAERLAAKAAKIVLHGSGDVMAHASEEVRVRLHGSGDVRIMGNPQKRDCSSHGSGEIKFR